MSSAVDSLGNSPGSASILQALFKDVKARVDRGRGRKTGREPWAEMRSVSQPLSYEKAHPAATRGSDAYSTELVLTVTHAHKEGEVSSACSEVCTQLGAQQDALNQRRLSGGGCSSWPIKGESSPKGLIMKNQNI